jgi:hypothetical protein
VEIGDPKDNLILHCILEHAGRHPAEEKKLLTGNSKDFGEAGAGGVLKAAGVTYLATAAAARGWLGSKANPSGPA